MSSSRVLILGGYGVFGGRLAAALVRDGRFEVIVAGRSIRAAQAFCGVHGGAPAALDRTAPDLAAQVAALRPAIVIDAAGPFQSYDGGYALARAALECGAHYIDLSDDAAFSAGIDRLDAAARAKGLMVISGASSVPGISSAAVEALARGMTAIERIESVILPGNRAPRGRSVIGAILAQVGRPIEVREGGRPRTVPGWSRPRRERIETPGAAPLTGRWSSVIGAPDLALFPARYGARTVLFRAGLELSILHLGLWALGLSVRAGAVRSLAPGAGALRRAAQLVERLGTDRGGMIVSVIGALPGGGWETRRWQLLVEAGDGPEIPTLVARILCGRIADGRIAPGARACLGAVDLAEVEAAAAGLSVRFARDAAPLVPLFDAALGPQVAALPAPVRDLHRVIDIARWEGRATVERGRAPLAALVCAMMRFPQSGADMPVTVEMRREATREIWRRSFAGRGFSSEMRLAGPPGAGRISERFGPFRFEIALEADSGGLGFPVVRGWLFGVALPRRLLPESRARESAAAGAARFDVEIALPLIGLVVRYAGWLRACPEGGALRPDAPSPP